MHLMMSKFNICFFVCFLFFFAINILIYTNTTSQYYKIYKFFLDCATIFILLLIIIYLCIRFIYVIYVINTYRRTGRFGSDGETWITFHMNCNHFAHSNHVDPRFGPLDLIFLVLRFISLILTLCFCM